MRFPDAHLPLEHQEPDTLLAITVWGEARGESPLGRAAVAHSILNRCRQKGLTVAQVVLKPWQYSCFNKSDPNSHKIEKLVSSAGASVPLGEWAVCYTSAIEAIRGESSDPSAGATHYVVKKLWMQPQTGRRAKWFELPCIANGTTKKTAVVDGHVFATTPW